jgi:hypothetical protein
MEVNTHRGEGKLQQAIEVGPVTMYAKRKGYDLRGIAVSVNHARKALLTCWTGTYGMWVGSPTSAPSTRRCQAGCKFLRR